jgi:hypothetical protein
MIRLGLVIVSKASEQTKMRFQNKIDLIFVCRRTDYDVLAEHFDSDTFQFVREASLVIRAKLEKDDRSV